MMAVDIALLIEGVIRGRDTALLLLDEAVEPTLMDSADPAAAERIGPSAPVQ